jgi:hypothetical protein
MRSYKGAKYIAMALSKDDRMGDDSVMECVKEGDQVKVYSSWTEVKNGDYYAAVRDGAVSKILKFFNILNFLIFFETSQNFQNFSNFFI